MSLLQYTKPLQVFRKWVDRLFDDFFEDSCFQHTEEQESLPEKKNITTHK